MCVRKRERVSEREKRVSGRGRKIRVEIVGRDLVIERLNRRKRKRERE